MDKMWLDKTREDRFVYEMIDPFNLSISRGFLSNVVQGSGSLTFGYDTATRVSGSFEAVNSGFEDHSLIRIHHYVDAYNYHNELGTFFAKKNNNYQNGINVESFSLTSMLDRVTNDCLEMNYPVGAGTSTKDALSSVFSRYNMEYSISPVCNNMLYPSSAIYEVGMSVMDVLVTISELQFSRLDVNGHGTIVVNPKRKHKDVSVSERIFKNDGILKESVTINDRSFDIINRILIKGTVDENTIYGYADSSMTSSLSYNRTGRRNTHVVSVTDIVPFTSAQAASVAKNQMKEYEAEPEEYVFDSVYFPLELGDVAEVELDDGRMGKGYLYSRTIKLAPGMITNNTLRGC